MHTTTKVNRDAKRLNPCNERKLTASEKPTVGREGLLKRESLREHGHEQAQQSDGAKCQWLQYNARCEENTEEGVRDGSAPRGKDPGFQF